MFNPYQLRVHCYVQHSTGRMRQPAEGVCGCGEQPSTCVRESHSTRPGTVAATCMPGAVDGRHTCSTQNTAVFFSFSVYYLTPRCYLPIIVYICLNIA